MSDFIDEKYPIDDKMPELIFKNITEKPTQEQVTLEDVENNTIDDEILDFISKYSDLSSHYGSDPIFRQIYSSFISTPSF